MPKVVDLRDKWIQNIETHQQYDWEPVYFSVCELHFEPDAIIRHGSSFKLKKGTLPTIFPDKKMWVATMYKMIVCTVENCMYFY